MQEQGCSAAAIQDFQLMHTTAQDALTRSQCGICCKVLHWYYSMAKLRHRFELPNALRIQAIQAHAPSNSTVLLSFGGCGSSVTSVLPTATSRRMPASTAAAPQVPAASASC